MISVPEGGQNGVSAPLLNITVDLGIAHPDASELSVILTSPEGTVVYLHNHSGAGPSGLNGNYPGTLQVDGPGELADFEGQDSAGSWVLTVYDTEAGNSGDLNVWGLHLSYLDPFTAVAEEDLPQVTRLLGNTPNPFNPRTTIHFDLARSEAVRLDVYDLRGRLVRRLLQGPVTAGNHQVVWDGRDGHGRAVASGAYVYRMVTGATVEQRKMLLVR